MQLYRRKKTDYDFILFIIYKIALDIIYDCYQYRLFGYYGFSYDYDFIRLILGWVLYIISAYSIKRKKSELSDVFVYTVLMLSIAPCIVFYEYNASCKFWMVACQVIVLVFMDFFISRPTWVVIKMPFPKVSYKNTLLRIIMTCFIMAFLAYLVYCYGFPSLSEITFSNISKIRASYNGSIMLTIIENVICKIICPLYMLIALKEKKYIAFCFALFVCMYSYAITGYKTFLFIPVIVVGVSFLPKLDLKKCILIGLPLVITIVGVLYAITENIMLYGLVNERVIFLPAKIKIAYFDYFSNNEYVYFSQSTIARILGFVSNYSENIPNLIGRVYFNRPEMWTNTGFMADAYSNLGYFGMITISLIVVFIIRIAEQQMKSLSFRMKKSMESLFLIYFISLNDGGAISIIFSGGMIVIIIIMITISFSE